MEPMVRIEDVHKRFGKLEVLRGVTTQIGRGEVVVLLGPSGSGKTTLLRCINHLDKLDGGRIYVDGELVGYREVNGEIVEDGERAIARKRAQIGMVFQRFNLFTHLTALGNVIEAPIRVKKMPKAEAEELAREHLLKVGLADKIDEHPNRRSRGKQPRLALARPLTIPPTLRRLAAQTSALPPLLPLVRSDPAATATVWAFDVNTVEFGGYLWHSAASAGDSLIVVQPPHQVGNFASTFHFT